MMIQKTHNPPSSPFIKGGIITPPFGLRPRAVSDPEGKGRLGGILRNSKGLSVLFLVIAMMLMVSIGYVFSYLIPTKQKSVSLVVSSNQAFFLAQSGVEFAVRYASDNGLSTLSSITKSLGRGSFTITYEPTPVDRLTSDGQIPNASQRKIVVRNFSQFVTLSPCWITPNQVARFYITNESPSNVTLDAFGASWTHTANTTKLREILMGPPGGAMTSRYSNNPGLDTPVAKTNLGTTQLILPGQALEINVRWQQPRVSGFTITFYSTTGGSYFFNFASGLLACP